MKISLQSTRRIFSTFYVVGIAAMIPLTVIVVAIVGTAIKLAIDRRNGKVPSRTNLVEAERTGKQGKLVYNRPPAMPYNFRK